jgi:hypothetical protein
MTYHSSPEEGTITSITLIAIVAALALLGVVVVTLAVTITLQQAEAEAAHYLLGVYDKTFLHKRGESLRCFYCNYAKGILQNQAS